MLRFVFSFPILLSSIVDCFIRSGHNSGEEGLGKSINIAVEQSPGEEWAYGVRWCAICYFLIS